MNAHTQKNCVYRLSCVRRTDLLLRITNTMQCTVCATSSFLSLQQAQTLQHTHSHVFSLSFSCSSSFCLVANDIWNTHTHSDRYSGPDCFGRRRETVHSKQIRFYDFTSFIYFYQIDACHTIFVQYASVVGIFIDVNFFSLSFVVSMLLFKYIEYIRVRAYHIVKEGNT